MTKGYEEPMDRNSSKHGKDRNAAQPATEKSQVETKKMIRFGTSLKEVELHESIRKAVEQDAEEASKYHADGFSHDWVLKELKFDGKQLSEALKTLDAGQHFRTRVLAKITHRWFDGRQSGAEDIEHLHSVKVWREETAKGIQFRVDAFFGCYWELIPDGSPGAVTEADYPSYYGV